MGIFDFFKKKEAPATDAAKDAVKSYACYDFNEEWYLIEMLLDLSAPDIDWDKITVPEKGVSKLNWQAPYMEQYLNEDGDMKICDTYDMPQTAVRPCRVTFFIFKVSSKILSTPYGDFLLNDANPVPDRLKGLIEFENVD